MLWTSQFYICQWVFFRITRGNGNFLGFWGKKALFLAGLLLGFRQGRLGDREHGPHGSFQPLKWGLCGRHGQHNTISLQGTAQRQAPARANYGSCFGDQRWGETDERIASAISWLIVANARLCAAATAP